MLSDSRPVKYLLRCLTHNCENEPPGTGKSKSMRNKKSKLMPKSPNQENTHED